MEDLSQEKWTKIDKKILAILQQDATLSVAEVANQVGLSQSPCWRRINRLEQAGLIRRRVALLDAQKLGLGVVVFVNVRLSGHADQSLREFEEAICAFPEVTECYTMTGSMDFHLRILVKDIQGYERFFRDHLSQMPAVREVHSSVAITQLKYTTELPLGLLNDELK
ncbi:AsnC family transcriptional regulator [Bacterioplanes sanyensis]|uniref:AsnC family transcriptional regulator n=1 Tax=Bacterioplanes sanyensis TaxID=1249553 RepID=A0A222FJY6_9GAMM|nr:Lrp/AsnC family transcriptional regulator [Bacterioplanes sanyensis]ASP38804.1 AsnC family transcriptional regulator [Bacterioplanes sanyensis]